MKVIKLLKVKRYTAFLLLTLFFVIRKAACLSGFWKYIEQYKNGSILLKNVLRNGIEFINDKHV